MLILKILNRRNVMSYDKDKTWVEEVGSLLWIWIPFAAIVWSITARFCFWILGPILP
jgi:hypothetical protein